MYIPLDEMYNWINSLMPDDMLIYRFYPHGSKNIENLCQLSSAYGNILWNQRVNRVPVVCHDQEPLHFSLYQDLDPVQLKQQALELYPTHDQAQPWLHNDYHWKTNCQLNLGAAVYMNFFPRADKFVLLHSEQRSSELQKYRDAGFVPAYWWSHGMIARDWYRFAQHDQRMHHSKNQYEFDFNVYARDWTGTRRYRLKLLDLLQQKNLHNHCRITFSHWSEHVHYGAHLDDLDTALEHIPDTWVSSNASATYDSDHYARCGFDLVTETLFDDERLHLTEKTLRPVACGKPFVLCATHGSLQYMREYGFETFGNIIDESYDTILDPVKRLQAVTDIVRDITGLSPQAKIALYDTMRPIVEHNRQHFFSACFADRLMSELEHNLKSAVTEITTNHMSGSRWIRDFKLMCREDKKPWSDMMHANGAPRQQIAELLKDCRRFQRGNA